MRAFIGLVFVTDEMCRSVQPSPN